MIAPVMLDSDKRTWRLLIAIARATVDKPSVRRSIAAFELQARVANKAVMPDQRPECTRPFMQLLNFAARWRALDEAHRVDNGPAVLDLAHRCAVLIGDEAGPFTPPDPPPPGVAHSRLPYKDDALDEDAA